MNEISELRLGPTSTTEGQRIALEELQRKINELVRTLNELSANAGA